MLSLVATLFCLILHFVDWVATTTQAHDIIAPLGHLLAEYCDSNYSVVLHSQSLRYVSYLWCLCEVRYVCVRVCQ